MLNFKTPRFGGNAKGSIDERSERDHVRVARLTLSYYALVKRNGCSAELTCPTRSGL